MISLRPSLRSSLGCFHGHVSTIRYAISKMSCQMSLYHYKPLTFYRSLTLLSSKLNETLCVFIYNTLFYQTHFSFTGWCITKNKKIPSFIITFTDNNFIFFTFCRKHVMLLTSVVFFY